MTDLFNTISDKKQDNAYKADKKHSPLADRVRPQKLSEIIGQNHILGKGKLLRESLERDQLFSMIFWGSPGVGKTTLARAIANETKSDYFSLSAVTAGVKDVRKVLEKAKLNFQRLQKKTILFIDEIHRFNKAQQDSLLHEVEDGTIYIIGATTENPSFEVIAPLLSRCRIFKLNQLDNDALNLILDGAIRWDSFLSKLKIEFVSPARDLLIRLSGGDARMALNALEVSVKMGVSRHESKVSLTVEQINEAFQSRALFYDKKGDYHYDVISAFIKSVRGSDPDAALFWLARMIDAGEDPKFIARRMVVLASEDIGNADPQALIIATSGFASVTYIGMPEGQIVLAQIATYLACAPKSNASYLGIKQAIQDVKNQDLKAVPLHLRNSPTSLMTSMGHGKDYKYPHDFDQHFVEQNYLPDELTGKTYYTPTENGYEKQIKEFLLRFWKKRGDKKPGNKKHE